MSRTTSGRLCALCLACCRLIIHYNTCSSALSQKGERGRPCAGACVAIRLAHPRAPLFAPSARPEIFLCFPPRNIMIVAIVGITRRITRRRRQQQGASHCGSRDTTQGAISRSSRIGHDRRSRRHQRPTHPLSAVNYSDASSRGGMISACFPSEPAGFYALCYYGQPFQGFLLLDPRPIRWIDGYLIDR